MFYGGSNACGAYAVDTFRNNIIVGGLFNSVDAINVYHIAQWSPPATGHINVTAIQQGFYDPAVDKLNQSDIVELDLCNAIPPYNIVESLFAVLDSSTLTGNFLISNAPAGNYYLVLKHRNCIETWSSSAINYVAGNTVNYNFSSSITNAFGNNMIQIDASPLKYAVYSGDINQDGNVDVTDLLVIHNDATDFLTGYVDSDLTGNNVVDVSDLILAHNNSTSFVSKITP